MECQRSIEIGSWWHPDHTWSGTAANLRLEPKPGGLFVERFPEGGFAEHMRVIAVTPNQLVRMSGGLGPQQEFAATGVMTIRFDQAAADTTRLVVDYRVAGDLPGETATWATAVDRVIGEQFQRLKAAGEAPPQ
jgi:uncharacterized protein YndB with AHSA1/START domain